MGTGIDLDRIEPGFLKAQRERWKTAKAKHAGALKAKKITFSKDLGPLLDKRPPLYKAIREWKGGGSLATVKAKYVAIKANAKEIETAIKAYQKQIKGLGGEAEKDLGALLSALLSDVVKVDYDYTKQTAK
ncbi:MAG: hypothetical protein IT317_16145 [Anaerolineales bacterium]|nr:hypothetical protein [Anaerolineales bacterium]